MIVLNRPGIAFGLLFSLAVARTVPAQTSRATPLPPPPGRVASPPLEGPETDLEPIRPDDAHARDFQQDAQDSGVSSASHDALLDPQVARSTAERIYAPKQPPGPIAERPSGPRPERRATWVPGYWDWDNTRSEFVWIGGVWQVPPPRSLWVTARWTRDQDGWYRKPGFWSTRRANRAVATTYSTAMEPAWRKTGPPADHPDDTPAAAPGPDFFYVPGHYTPAGDQLKWRGGFWTKAQTGWEWIPARWVRRSTGWEFRAGYWVADPTGPDTEIANGGRSRLRARPLPPPGGSEDDRDVIAEAEAGRNRDGLPMVVVPGPAMPYYVIRPPGTYPYGPGGVVVPGAVPPFVRRLLDQVLP